MPVPQDQTSKDDTAGTQPGTGTSGNTTPTDSNEKTVVNGWSMLVSYVPENVGIFALANGQINWSPGQCNAGGEVGPLNGTPPSGFPADPDLVSAYGQIMLLLPIGATPALTQYHENVLGFPRSYDKTYPIVSVSYTNAEIKAACALSNQGPWTLWQKTNDDVLSNNSGSIDIAVTLLSPPEQTKMPRYIFSTGDYVVSLPLPLPAYARQVKGVPGGTVLPIANLSDFDTETRIDLPRTDGNNFRYLEADYGAIVDIGRVSVYNVTLTGAGATLQCYVSATQIANGDFSGATALPATITPTDPANDWEFAVGAVGTSASGRYLYIVPGGGATACTLGDLDVRATEYRIAAMQDVQVSVTYQSKELRGATTHNLFPIADAQFGGEVSVQAQYSDLVESSIRQFTGAMIDAITAPGNKILTVGGKSKPLPFVGELRTRDTNDKSVRLITYHTIAPGFTWSQKQEDFAGNQFSAKCRMPAATAANVGRVARFIFEQ